MTEHQLPSPARWLHPGLLRRLLADPVPVLDELAEEYGPMIGLGAGPTRMAVVGDPAALRELFALPTGDFRWGHKFNVLGFVVGDASMLISDGTDHIRRSAAVHPAFGRRRLNGWIPMIVARTDAAIDRVEAELEGSERVVDLYAFGRSLVLEILVRASVSASPHEPTRSAACSNGPRPTSSHRRYVSSRTRSRGQHGPGFELIARPSMRSSTKRSPACGQMQVRTPATSSPLSSPTGRSPMPRSVTRS